MPTLDRPVSYWSWGLMTRCPYSYKLTLVDKLKTDQKLNHERGVLGSIVHHTIEHALKPDDKDKWLQWDLCFHQAMTAVGPQTDSRTLNSQVKKAKRGIDWIVKNLKPLLVPENKFHSELTMKVPLPEIPNVLLNGRVDLVIEGPDWVSIFDHKGVAKQDSLTKEQIWFYKQLVKGTFPAKPVKDSGYLWFSEELYVPVNPDFMHLQMVTSIQELKRKVEAQEYEHRIGRHCSYCNVKEHCAPYKALVGQSDGTKSA